MFKKVLIIILAIVLIGVVGYGIYYWLGQKQKSVPEKYTGPVEKITFGVETSLLPSLVWVAENKGYFQEQGLDVNIKEYDSGKNALKAMLDEGVPLDMVTVAQAPIMFNSFNRADFGLIGTMVYSGNDVKILARKDKGISAPTDLKGKKIGVTKGSTGNYFLGLFLTRNDLSLTDVELVDFKATELAQALADGKVEAISTWEPNISKAKELLVEKAMVFPAKDIFREDFYFVVKKDFAQNHPSQLGRFLRAIAKAEQFTKENKEESIDIVSQRLKIARESIASLWNDFEFHLILDQSILTCLEDEAKWAIANNLTDKTEIPNYLDFIYLDALKQVKPEAVTIIK